MPRFDYFLYREHVAAGSDSRAAAGGVWTAHGAMRSGAAGGVSGWARGAVVGESRESDGGVREDLGAGCGTVCEGGRPVEAAGALFAAVLQGAAAWDCYAFRARVERFGGSGEKGWRVCEW